MMTKTSSTTDLAAGCTTLVDLAQWRARQQPDQGAYTFLEDGDEAGYFTYSDLDRQARAIGALLQSTVSAGARVILLFPPGLDFIAAFFGCLYSGVIAVPAYPPVAAAPDAALPRLTGLIKSAEPAVVLTTAVIQAFMQDKLPPEFGALRWLASDGLDSSLADGWREPAISGDTLAFLQYTSGSTATPKGVMVSHANLLHNERVVRVACQHSEESTFVGWLPLYHDMGLIGNVMQPLYIGAHCILMSPLSFLKSPYRWLQTVTRYRARTSGGPNFAYDLCTRKITEEQKATLDLSSWTVAFNGAEPIRAETLARFTEAFEPCGFRPETFFPCYGLAEATLFVTGGKPDERPTVVHVQKAAVEQNQVVIEPAPGPETRTLVGSGRAWSDVQVIIVDPETRTAVDSAAVGEIWIKAPSVTHGYWNLPEESAATFDARLADSGAGPFLRTGDLGFMKDGELFVTGRLKDLIIISGRNHYPQDIELTVEQSDAAVRPGGCIAFSTDMDDEECLVIVAEVDPRTEVDQLDEVTRTIRQAVTERHNIRAHDIALLRRGIPKTTSGKPQRRACRADYLAGRLERIEGTHE